MNQISDLKIERRALQEFQTTTEGSRFENGLRSFVNTLSVLPSEAGVERPMTFAKQLLTRFASVFQSLTCLPSI
jgi:hypothetical protein